MLILRCVYLGEMHCLLAGAGSVGALYPVRLLFPGGPTFPGCTVTQGGTTPLAAASCPALESAPPVTTIAPSPQGPGCSGGGGHRSAQLGGHRWQDHPRCPVPSPLPPVLGGGGRWILGYVPRCPGLRDLRCWNRVPGPPEDSWAQPPLLELPPDQLASP